MGGTTPLYSEPPKIKEVGFVSSSTSLDKPIVETAYLTAQNVHRYRTILRHFYRHHQQLNYWLTLEDILSFMTSEPSFAAYNREQCEQDLNALVGWKNLLATQDVGKVQTIEEFKNRRFRYQLSSYTIEIERLTIKLESISGVGGSLEANLFERIAERLRQMSGVSRQTGGSMHSWWQDLSVDFQRLNDNATDYIASLQRGKLDELLNTQAFLVYKDGIIEYLRSFIRELQRFGPTIESLLQQISPDEAGIVLDAVITYEKDIPRIDQEIDLDELTGEIYGQWSSLNAWFCGSPRRESEAARLLGITNSIIRRLTRLAYRLAETQNSLVSRHRECLHLAHLFARCPNIEEAHRLSAAVLGPAHTRHLWGEFERHTDSNLQDVWEEPPAIIPIKPRVRGFRERLQTEGIRSRAEEKKRTLSHYLRLQQEEQNVLEQHIRNSVIDFETLPIIEPHVRVTLLRWIGKAMGNKERIGHTEDGRTYKVEIHPTKRICLECQDGHLDMPAIKLHFLEGGAE
jgi:uncharacterized protein (TIGR02677 family)